MCVEGEILVKDVKKINNPFMKNCSSVRGCMFLTK